MSLAISSKNKQPVIRQVPTEFIKKETKHEIWRLKSRRLNFKSFSYFDDIIVVQCNLDLVTLNLVTTCNLVTQYNKLAPNTLWFTYWSLKSCKPHEKMLDLLIKNWKLRVWCSLLHFFMWFATFQILICELQIIWHTLLVLSWLYKDQFHFTT